VFGLTQEKATGLKATKRRLKGRIKSVTTLSGALAHRDPSASADLRKQRRTYGAVTRALPTQKAVAAREA
jgi:hypothetical protein